MLKSLRLPVMVLLTLVAGAALAREEIPAESRLWSWSADLAQCDSPAVLSQIQGRFGATERRYWGGTVEISGFEKVRPAAFRPHGLDLIPRRYCQAVALMSNKRRLAVRYAIIEGSGFAGYPDAVQFCVDGYDRNHTAMAGCARLDR